MKIRSWLILLAWLVYGTSFVMPAVGNDPTKGLLGWRCAFYALMLPFLAHSTEVYLPLYHRALLLLSGSINLLMIASLLGSMNAKLRRFSGRIAWGAVAMLPCSWIYLAIPDSVFRDSVFRPLIGHWMWAGSILALAILLSVGRKRAWYSP
jgi:hypothetical protein